MRKRKPTGDQYRARVVRLAESYGFTEADIDRVFERLGRYPTMPEVEAASHRLVARIMLEGHSE